MNKFRKRYFLLIAVLAIALLTACNSGNETNNSEGTTEEGMNNNMPGMNH